MAQETLLLKDIGPIRQAGVTFGDLTVLVGPQASGKSICLQFLKLLLDTGPIFRTLRKHGLEWNRDARELLELYLGEGMGSLGMPGEAAFCGRDGPQKRLMLTHPEHDAHLPYMVWSAGQREFMPLLLGLYWLLLPTKVKRRGSIQWVIIEEPEMGLHPRAIETMLVIILDLLWRGYRICLSTHSLHVLDLVWALQNLRRCHADPKFVLRILGVESAPKTNELGSVALKKTARVYYFDPLSGRTTDISSLDPASGESIEAGWGGLTEFSGRVADIVAEAVSGKPG